jgi:acyl-coenzyme A synthetase/AMP-(fatty) acid ligase
MKQNSLGIMFLSLAETYRERIAIRSGNGDLTYAGFKSAVISCALHLKNKGVEQGALVSIDMKPTGVESIGPIVTTLAVSLLGAHWIQHDPAYLAEGSSLDVSRVLTNRLDGDLPGIYLKVSHDFFTDLPANYQAHESLQFDGYGDDDSFFIAASSGTTGEPKKMAISSTMMFERAISLTEFQDLQTPLLLTTKFIKISNMAVLHMLATFLKGGTYVLAESYKAMSGLGVNHVVASPAQFKSLLADVPVPSKPEIFQAKVVGSGLPSKLLKVLLQYFQTVRVSYGSTEAGPVTTRLIAEYSNDTSVGTVNTGPSVEIVDKDNKALKPGELGEIRIKSRAQIAGYKDAPQASAEAFREGWFYPGDIGYLGASGQLYIRGRVKDHLNIGGVKFNPHEIDELIVSTEGISEGMCFTDQDQDGFTVLAAAISVAKGQNVEVTLNSLLSQFKQKGLGEALFPKHIYPVTALPQNVNGKTGRHTLTEAVRNVRPIVITIDSGALH